MENKQIIGDFLNRNAFIETIYQYITKNLTTNSKPLCFSIDGEWGQGKSWILNKLQNKLEGYDLSTNLFNEDNYINKYFIFRYNAWELDFYEDPLIAIVITLVEQLNQLRLVKLDNALQELIKKATEILVTICGQISKKVLGVDIVSNVKDLNTLIKKSKDLSKIKTNTTKKSITEDIENLLIVLNKLCSFRPIIFIVDEIDRCLPEYAIKTLERLHHIFAKVPASLTIIATDEKQLTHSIQAIYGLAYDAKKYLQKFIMFSFKLSYGKLDTINLSNALLDIKNKTCAKELNSEESSVLDNILNGLTPRELNLIFDRTLISLNTIENINYDFNNSSLMVGCLFISIINYYKSNKDKKFSTSNISPYCANNPSLEIEKYLKPLFVSINKIHIIHNEDILKFILLIILSTCILKEKRQEEIFYKCSNLPAKTQIEISSILEILVRYYNVNVILN